MDATGLPYLPGTSTVSEMLAVAERGRTEMKFFPAEAAGGAPFLASLASPLPQLRFCPTGGDTLLVYLSSSAMMPISGVQFLLETDRKLLARSPECFTC
jgi:2-keto-3-deoxy-6-phosphogluconate aldolase